MVETGFESMTEDPDGSDPQIQSAPPTRGACTTFTEIVNGYLESKNPKAKADISAGDLDKTLPEAVHLMATALAEHFAGSGTIHGTNTPLPSHIAEAAKQTGQKTPLYRAFESTLGQLRMKMIRQKVRATILSNAAVEDEAKQRALREALTSVGRSPSPYKGLGWGMKYTIVEAHDVVVEKIEAAARRYLESNKTAEGVNTEVQLTNDVLDRSIAFQAAETKLAGPRIAALEAACLPTTTEMLSLTPLESLISWNKAAGFTGQPSLASITKLAKQCAKMDLLGFDDLDALSTDVARRIHHPFGLMDTQRHAHMLAAQYVFKGEAPYCAMDLAWRLLIQNDAAASLTSRNYENLVGKVFAALYEGIRLAKRYVYWLGLLDAQPAAADVIRLLAAVVTATDDHQEKEIHWPEGLLETVLERYGVDDTDISSTVALLQNAFPLSEETRRKANWTNPAFSWNTVGSTYRYLLVDFAFKTWLSQADLEDLKDQADQRIPEMVLSDLRDGMVRADSTFPQGTRRIFNFTGVLGTNSWLKQNLQRRATRTFAQMEKIRKDAYRTIRGLAQTQLHEEIQNATGNHNHHPDERPSPGNWFALATSQPVLARLNKLVSSATALPEMTASETRDAALMVLNFLVRAQNYPRTAPRSGQDFRDWLLERVEEKNSLGQYMEDPDGTANTLDEIEEAPDMDAASFIDLYAAENLAILLEVTVRQAQGKNGK